MRGGSGSGVTKQVALLLPTRAGLTVISHPQHLLVLFMYWCLLTRTPEFPPLPIMPTLLGYSCRVSGGNGPCQARSVRCSVCVRLILFILLLVLVPVRRQGSFQLKAGGERERGDQFIYSHSPLPLCLSAGCYYQHTRTHINPFPAHSPTDLSSPLPLSLPLILSVLVVSVQHLLTPPHSQFPALHTGNQ
jgi:hypothetical protein